MGTAGGGSSYLVQTDCILSAMSISAIVNGGPAVFEGTVRFSAGGAPLHKGFRILPLSTLPGGRSHCPGHFAEHTTTGDQMRVSQERKCRARRRHVRRNAADIPLPRLRGARARTTSTQKHRVSKSKSASKSGIFNSIIRLTTSGQNIPIGINLDHVYLHRRRVPLSLATCYGQARSFHRGQRA